MCDPVARGFGYTVLYEHLIRTSLVFNEVQIIAPKEPIFHSVSVIYKKHWPLHPRYQTILEHVRKQFKELSLSYN